MSSIRELSLSEIEFVSGGSANGQDAGERSNYGRSDRSNNNRGAPATTANNAGIGIIAGTLGALVGLAGGPIGAVAAGAVLGGLGASMPTPSSGGWHDTNPGNVAGQCSW